MGPEDMSTKKSKAENTEQVDFEALAEEVAELKDTLSRSAAENGVQQKAFDTLYEELKQYKEDFIFQNEK